MMDLKLLNFIDLCWLYGVSTTTMEKIIAEPGFPKHLVMGGERRWLTSDIEIDLKSRRGPPKPSADESKKRKELEQSDSLEPDTNPHGGLHDPKNLTESVRYSDALAALRFAN